LVERSPEQTDRFDSLLDACGDLPHKHRASVLAELAKAIAHLPPGPGQTDLRPNPARL
jgi:hypothetical protein